MVIVLTGPAGSGVSATGAALAEHLGWAFVDGGERTRRINVVRAACERALDRREPLVAACPLLAPDERERIAHGLRPVRFVQLDKGSGEAADGTLLVNRDADVHTVVGYLRLAFGI